MKIRLRIALLMAGALLATASVALVVNALTYERTVYRTPNDFGAALLSKLHVSPAVAEAYVKANPEVVFNSSTDKPIGPGLPSVNEAFRQVQQDSRRDAVRRSRLLTLGGIGVLTVLTGAIGWLIAGRLLRPVRLITRQAQSASADDLSARVALDGPDDELKVLADTFDSMLDRLERSFVAQRRFSAQVSHELRTPLSIVRSEADLLAATPLDAAAHASVDGIRAAAEQADRIVTRLLELARSTGGHVGRDQLALDVLVGDVVADLVESDAWRQLRVELDLDRALVTGDPTLLDSLVRNLADNAARHNRPEGWVNVAVRTVGEHAVLDVTNSAADGSDPHATGIGSSLAGAIVDAHGGTMHRTRLPDGSVRTRVELPRTHEPTSPVHVARAQAS